MQVQYIKMVKMLQNQKVRFWGFLWLIKCKNNQLMHRLKNTFNYFFNFYPADIKA